MKASMKRDVLETMEPAALARACMQPVIGRIRAQSQEVKSAAYAELTKGQQALMMFLVLHDHVGTDKETLYVWVSQLLGQPKTWEAIKDGLRHLGDEPMLQILGELEAVCAARRQEHGRDWLQARADDLDESPAFATAIEVLDARFRETAPATFERIAWHVRQHPEEFVEIEA